MYRTKTMTLEEWPKFQANFEELFTQLRSDKRLGLFIDNGRAAEPRAVLITDYQSELIERLSPGGWADCPDASEREWIPLCVDGDPVDYGLKGVELPGH